MRTKIFIKIPIWVLVFFELYLSGASAVFSQTPDVDGRIAFVSSRDGNREIYSINPDGTGITRLTINAGEDNYPAWSPDGRKIAYLSQIPSGGGQALLKIMNADGSGQRVVTPINFNLATTNFCGERFALDWSPDGSKIVFQEFGNIVTVNIDGTNRQNVTNTPVRESEPSWGLLNQIAYSSSDATQEFPNSGLWIYLTTFPGGNFGNYGYYTCAVSPDLSADGAKIAYVDGDDLVPPGKISIANSNPPFNERNLGFYGVMTVRWSPSGNLFVLGSLIETNPGIQYRIEVIDEFGQGRRILTEGINPAWGRLAVSRTTSTDFDGDGKADVSVFRPSNGVWYLNQSTIGFSATQFGLTADKLAPADYDGDGRTDIAVFHKGTWYLLRSNEGFTAIQFGQPGDAPQPADFTGDGRAELAVYRSGVWFTFNLTDNQANAVQFSASNDKPVVGDYDGDSRADYAVYRDGTWYLFRSTQGFAVIQFGLPTDRLVPADYDGNGKTDQAVYRDGTWYVIGSQSGFTAFQFGIPSDEPVPADYDGDGRTDTAIFRDGTWYLRQSANGLTAAQFGSSDDIPVPGAFMP